MPVPANAKEIYSYLTSHGATANAAAGVLGNIEQESGGDPQAGSLGSGYGIIQWTPGSRYFSGPVGLSEQLPAMLRYIDQNGGMGLLNKHASTPQEAALFFSEHYERPAAADANNANRTASAAAVASAARSGNWPKSSDIATGSGSPGTGSTADITDAFSSILDPLKEANSLFHDLAELVNWAVILAEPSQQWRLLSGVVMAGSAYGAVKLHDNNFPVSVLFMGVALGAGYMAFRPWPVSDQTNAPYRPAPYAVDVVTGNPPDAGPPPSSHVGEIQVGLESVALIWAAGKAAGALSQFAAGAGIGGLVRGALDKLKSNVESDLPDIAEGA